MQNVQLLLVIVIFLFGVNCENSPVDTREGENVVFKCRFNKLVNVNDFTYYWARWTNFLNFDNVAIGGTQLNSNYRIDFRPDQGVYDLRITNVSYSRDNGRFECRIKAVGTGADVHQEYYNLTVLTPPQPPLIAPGKIVMATEGKQQELTCSSVGGSPEPTITWYREGNNTPLRAITHRGGSREMQATSTLTFTPTKEDDNAGFKCVVWNRAMPEGQQFETTATLSVNYHPRVQVGPENPLRVERDGTAVLECNVDSKPKVTSVRWTHNGRLISSNFIHTIQGVSIHDAGKYTCSADNGLGKNGESEVTLDVQYPPVVVIEKKTFEAEERESVTIRCNVTSNPPPVQIEWMKEGNPDFRYAGETLTLTDVRAEHAGTYICRGINVMKPFGGKKSERIGNTTVALLVRHRPGKAFITPNKPVVHVGNAVTLTCAASPPGWPVPQYKWYRDVSGEISSTNVLAQGSQYVIPRAHLGTEGTYHCMASNEMGHGEEAKILLEVHQPPQFLAKLQQHITRRVDERDYSITCSAKGKPKPSVRWLKDGHELSLEQPLYQIDTNPVEGSNGVVTVQSTLRFIGEQRPDNNQLLPNDRGMYSCLYENEVNSANSTMHFRIEHAPIMLHQYNKVAFDPRQTAEVVCKVQAYPKPEFQWQFGTNSNPISSDGHYEISTTTDNNDIYTSILKINNLKHRDYGDYVCRVTNSINQVRAKITLQQRGPPEKPLNLQASEIGSNFVTLSWDAGFDGGLKDTKYFVFYRSIALTNEELINDDCRSRSLSSTEWMEFDCHRDVPCNITPLDQHQSYEFKVKAMNTKGNSDFSNLIISTTKVNKIPSPLQVTFDPESKELGINVGKTCLALIAIVESIVHENTPMAAWRIVETIQVHGTGHSATYKKAVIEHLNTIRNSNLGRSLGDEEELTMALEGENSPKVRVKLCLKLNNEQCGEYTEAEIGSSLSESSELAMPTLIAIIVSCIVFLLFAGLMLMFCRCKRNQQKKGAQAKDYEMDAVRPTIVAAQQNQAPPPYYTASGLENKALEHSMELALAMEEQKSMYAAQNGYGYQINSSMQMSSHNIPGNEWGYVDNSTADTRSYMVKDGSNNGGRGSVNSQDSLWQLKMGGNASNQVLPSQYYGYDPTMSHGYGTMDDYATYPHNSNQLLNDEYQHNMMNSQSPYAAVHKNRAHSEQQLEYSDVNGLPTDMMYMDQMDHSQMDHQSAHLSHDYDDNLESEYSTNRRKVIREIIV